MIGASVRVVGMQKTREALARIKSRVQDPSGFLGYAGAQGHKEIMRHFREEIGPDGKWAPLKYRQGKPLQDTGRLRGSVIWQKLSDYGVRFWSLVKYAATHQFGAMKQIKDMKPDEGKGVKPPTDRNIPARPFMWFPDNFVEYLANKYRKYVLKG